MANDLLKLKMFNPQAFKEKFGNGVELNDPANFGGLSDSASPIEDSGGFGNMLEGGLESIIGGGSSQKELDSGFINRNKNIGRQIHGASKVSDAAAGIASNFGPIGLAVGAGLKVGDALNKSATDEFGVVKDKGKAIAAGILNPITGLSTAFGQKDRKEAKNAFVNTEIASAKAENQIAGNKITNAIPRYTPPSYGRFGRKLTKFAK